jgi:hypothetical protein
LPATKKQEQGKVDDLITRVNNANVKLEKINGPEPQGEYNITIKSFRNVRLICTVKKKLSKNSSLNYSCLLRFRFRSYKNDKRYFQ